MSILCELLGGFLTEEIKDISIGLVTKTGKLRKLTLPSNDVGTHDMLNPVVQPDSQTEAITLTEFEKIYYTFPLVNKAINIRVVRVMGEGFDLQTPDKTDVNINILEEIKSKCEIFLDELDYVSFGKQAMTNALVSGNEFTEMVFNRPEMLDLNSNDSDIPRYLLTANHGDYKTIDFRRDLITNKILLDGKGHPVGYWQRIESLQDLYATLRTKFGSVESLENMEASKKRLSETSPITIYDNNNYERGVMFGASKPNYIFLNQNEIVHLKFYTLNDNYYGVSLILAPFDDIQHLKDLDFASVEAYNSLGFPKSVLTVGDDKHTPNEKLMSLAAETIKDPVRKEGFVLPNWMKLEYLQAGSLPTGAGGYNDYFISKICVGLQTPQELLLGAGSSNRATAFQNSSDYDKMIFHDRKIMVNYYKQILSVYISSLPEYSIYNDIEKYIPDIVWPLMVTQDDILKEDQIMKKYQMGLITHAEAREKLGEIELEDAERSNKFVDELAQPDLSSEDSFTQYTPKTGQHRLLPKKKMDIKLNKEFKTDDVDYAPLVKDIGKKIVTVPKYKLSKVREIIANGNATKQSPTSIRKAIHKLAPKLTDAEITRILYNEQNMLGNEARFESAKNEGFKYKKWYCVKDNKTTNISKSINGQVRAIDEDFTTEYKDEKGQLKSWQGTTPPEAINSRDQIKYFKRKPVEGKPLVKNYNWEGGK